jgi:antitoxin MazE
MKSRIIQIGNSRGVRVPKSLLEQSHWTDDVRIAARENEIVIRPAARQGWEEAFRVMAEERDDDLFDESPPSSFDETEWEW